ncbi:MAG: amidohydrolase family protein [Bacteroidota bacterium]
MRFAILLSITSLFQNIFAQQAVQPLSNNYIIRNVNIIPIYKDTLIKNQMVIITGNKITLITDDNDKAFQPVERYTFIDGRDKYLMPGMADMHAHFAEYSELKKYFTLNLLAGVTTMRSMRGDEKHLNIKKDKDLPQLNLYLSAPPITKGLTINKHTADSIVTVSKENGFMLLKVLSIKDSLSFINLAAACKKNNFPFCGHGLSNISMPLLLKSGYNSIEHLTGYAENLKKGETYVENLIKLTAKNKVYNCATEDYFEIGYNMKSITDLKKRNGLQYMADTTIAKWDKELNEDQAKIGEAKLKEQREYYTKIRATKNKVLMQLVKSGAYLLIGPDAGGNYSVPGFAIQEEMKHHSNAGLSNYQVLCAATINAAKYMNQSNKWGTVEINKDANLILLNTNPLEDLNNLNSVEGVFLNAEYKTVKELETGLK